MSRSKNRELSFWKDVLARLGCVGSTWRGFPLSKLDQATYAEAILLGTLVLNDLSSRYEGCGDVRDHVAWALNCVSTDVDRLAAFLSDAILLWRSLSEGPSVSGIASYGDFKDRLAQQYPFAGALLSPVRRAVELYVQSPSPHLFYPVYQFLNFLTHLSLVDIDLSDELEAEYKANEERLQQLSLPEPFVEQMNSVMRTWLKDFRIEANSFVPSHGPGSIAELRGDRTLYSKYQALAPDALIAYVFKKFAGLDVQTCVPLERGVPTLRRPKCLVPLERVEPTSRQSAIVIVPKSMKTKRVISKEPATLMYFQQGVARELEKFISHHSYLSRRIDFRDQALQREAALEASRTRQFATVDLSAASDSVSYDLVKRVFHGTALYPFLVALRSRSTELPSGEVVEVRKFAPMGSALCFPIESLIFACIVECTARYVRYETGVSNFQFRVYGDDIIVPDHCLYDLVIFLRWCGFRINESKTYGGPNRFRESCGCDAYDGSDVTCMKIGRRFSSRQVSPRTPGVFAGLISMANSANEYQFGLLRRYLVDKLINGTRWVPLFSGDPNVGVYSPSATNFRLPHRQNRRWFEEEVLAAMAITVQSQLSTLSWDDNSNTYIEGSPLPDSEELRYFETLRRTYGRTHAPFGSNGVMRSYCASRDAFSADFRTEVSIGSACSYLSKRWVVPS